VELQKLGFSQYEARAYLGLLQNSPVTGYELSKRSGVPRSMIYEVAGKLIERGAAYTVPTEPVKYSPVPARELIERLRRETEQTLGYLEESLSSLETSPEMDVIWHIKGQEAVTADLLTLIESTRQELWLSVWQAQVGSLTKAVEQAEGRGVKVFSVIFAAETARLGVTFRHEHIQPEVPRARLGGHLTVAIRDSQEVLIAEFLENGNAWAIKTRDPALVMVSNEYIRHDIMIEVMTKELGAARLDRLWRNNPDLKQIVTGKQEESNG